MNRQLTRKFKSDQALFKSWEALPATAHAGLAHDELKAAQLQLQGSIVLPGDPRYDSDRRIYDPVFDYFPAAIVYCTCETDVGVALALARRSGMRFTLRSGGHCTAGFSAATGTLLIDLSLMNDVFVDTTSQIATARPGCPWATFDKALDAAGLHVPGGECGEVCVAGYMQGGGYGFTSVTYGMNCDNVIDMRVMLADGSIVVASQSQNTDLWWAMRGGTGGNFGVLLQVRYQLRPLGQVFGWALIWPLQTATDLDNATGALMTLQQQYMLANTNPNLNIQVSLAFQPGIVGGLPLTGPQQPFLLLRGLYVGNSSDGLAAIQALVNLPGGTLQWTKMDSFIQQNNDLLNLPYPMPAFPEGSPTPFEDKASRIVARALNAGQWRALLELFRGAPNNLAYFYMELYGGAINSQPPQANAFVHRSSAFNAVLDVFWWNHEERPASELFLQAWMDLMAPVWDGEIYQNYPRLNEPDYGRAYWGSAQAGLAAVKQKYDPQGAFRFAQQVAPPMPAAVAPLPPWLQGWLDQPILRQPSASATQVLVPT